MSTLWLHRCSHRHSRDLTLHENELICQTRLQITDLYQYRSSVLPTDRWIFQSSLSSHLQQNHHDLRAWLNTHAHYIQDSHNQAVSQNLIHTAPLTSYFHSIWNPTMHPIWAAVLIIMLSWGIHYHSTKIIHLYYYWMCTIDGLMLKVLLLSDIAILEDMNGRMVWFLCCVVVGSFLVATHAVRSLGLGFASIL